tara:strand:+ start:4365 stop:7496 length:3132 start_codon:yes stop_codon:yes gene_type:complete
MATNEAEISRPNYGGPEPVESGTATQVYESVSVNSGEIWPKVESNNIEALEVLGIKDTSPEILLMSGFLEMYTREPTRTYSNGNFDLLTLQTQLDLILKTIINEKIENSPNLKNKIIENYKEKLGEFFQNKSLIEDFSQTFLGTFDFFNLSENLFSKIQNTSNQNIRNLMSVMGYDFSQNKVEGFLKDGFSKGISSAANVSFSSNAYYKRIINTIYYNFFSMPVQDLLVEDFSPDGSGSNLSPLNETQIIKETTFLSRYMQIDSKINSNHPWINLLGESFPSGLSTIEDWRNLGRGIVGNPLNFFNDKVINQRVLKDENNKSIIVFSEVPNYENEPGKISGLEYFSKDIISKMTSNSNEDFLITTYIENLKSQLNYLESGFSSFDSSYFNGYISSVCSAAYDAFNIGDLITNTSEISSLNPEDIIPSLTVIHRIFAQRTALTSLEIEGTPGSTDGVWVDFYRSNPNLGVYTNGLYQTVTRFPSGFSDGSQGSARYNLFTSDSQKTETEYNILKNSGDYVSFKVLNSTDVAYYPNRSGDALAAFLTSIYDLYSQSSYVSFRDHVFVAFKILHMIFKDSFSFYFKERVDGTIVDRDCLISNKGIEALHVLKRIKENGNVFIEDSGSKVINIETTSSDKLLQIKQFYRDVTYPYFQSYNIVYSMIGYLEKIEQSISALRSDLAPVTSILSDYNLGFDMIGEPSIEKVTKLNVEYKRSFLPTTSFSENNSYFSYRNSRISNDLIAINTFHRQNPSLSLRNKDLRFVAIGIPDGLISKLRNLSSRSSRHTIIEISLLSLNHKFGNSGNPARFTCRYKYLFNTCLHVDTVNPEINIEDIIASDDINYEDLLNIDGRSKFTGFDFNEEDLFTFNFGKFNQGQFSLNSIRNIDDSIRYNKNNYNIIPRVNPENGENEYTFNNRMSKKIIKNHMTSYILKKNFEIFNGACFDENNFSYFGNEILTLENSSEPSNILNNYFDQQEYTDVLKKYLKKMSITSPIINPESFIPKLYGFSKFDRIFFVPCFRVGTANSPINYDFAMKSLIPIVRLL